LSSFSQQSIETGRIGICVMSDSDNNGRLGDSDGLAEDVQVN
jgi:hypothetical protein